MEEKVSWGIIGWDFLSLYDVWLEANSLTEIIGLLLYRKDSSSLEMLLDEELS
jgi:hypothetical protein